MAGKSAFLGKSALGTMNETRRGFSRFAARAAFTVLILIALWPVGAFAQCNIQNTFPSNWVHPPSEFGDRRNGGRKHTGTDFFYPVGTKVVIPEPCKILPWNNGSLIWNTNPAGYGYYMVLDCGTQGGDTVRMRYAHIPQNGYNAPTKEILQGDSGNAKGGAHHYHVETIIGDRPVDTQCVLGMVKSNQNADGASVECKKCPIPPRRANMCEAAVRSALVSHGAGCTNNARKPISGSSTIDPNSIRNSNVTGSADPASGTAAPGSGTSTTSPHGDGGHTGNDGDEYSSEGVSGYTGNANDLIDQILGGGSGGAGDVGSPNTEGGTGTKGGEADLVPKLCPANNNTPNNNTPVP